MSDKAREQAREAIGYEAWGFQVIKIICDEPRIDPSVKVADIRCVVNHDGHYPKSFANGDTPEEAWEGEIEALEVTE